MSFKYDTSRRNSPILYVGTHFFCDLLPAPVSLKPLAKGLWSILSWVIWKCALIGCFISITVYAVPYKTRFPYTYLFILVGRDRDELRLLEHISPEGGVGQLEDVVGPDQVEPRLVLVHRVENGLQQKSRLCSTVVHRETERSSAVVNCVSCHSAHIRLPLLLFGIG